MESLSTLTTNPYMSTELNNNVSCANDTCSPEKLASIASEAANLNVAQEPSAADKVSPSESSVPVVECVELPVDVIPSVVETDTNSLLLPPLIEMPSDPNQGNEMLQNLPKDTGISFPDVSAQTLDENQDTKDDLPDSTDPTSLLNPNAASFTDPLRTPPRPMIEDRTSVTDQLLAVATSAAAPPVVTVKASELEQETKEKENETVVDFSATSVKQEPIDGSMTDQLEKLDEKIEEIRRNKLNGPSDLPSPHSVHQPNRTSHLTTNQSSYQPVLHQSNFHMTNPNQASTISRPPISHPYGGHHYFPRSIPSHQASNYSMDPSDGIPHHRYSSSIGQIPFHHQSSVSEEDEDREVDTPESPDCKDSALNLAMNPYQHHQQTQQHYQNIGTISQPLQIQQHHSNHQVSSQSISSYNHPHLQQQHQALGPPVHHQQGHFQAHPHHPHQSLPQHHFPHHQLPPGRNPYHSNPPPPLISSLASSMSRSSTNSLTYNQANNGTANEHFQMMNQHLPPPNHHPFADPSVHPSTSHLMATGYRPPTSIPVSVVTSLSEIRRKQSLNSQYNTLVNGSSVQEYKPFVDQNKSDNMRCNNSSITVKSRTALPSSVITTGTRSSSRTNTVTGVHEGGAGGITGSNDLVSAISGQTNGSNGIGAVSSSHIVGNNHRVVPVNVCHHRPQPLPSGNPAKPYKCPLCSKELASKNVYQLHLRSHSGERPFSCNLCGNAFSQKTSLTRHMRSHTGERPYPCKICCKRFADKERIKIHMRTHTGEKPFSCPMCGKTFSQKSTVKRHMSVHTGAKPYKCPQCDKGFANRGNLTAHAKTHQLQQSMPPTPASFVSGNETSPKLIRGSRSFLTRHPSGSSNQSSASETSGAQVTGGTLVIGSPSLHRQDTQGSTNSSTNSSAMMVK